MFAGGHPPAGRMRAASGPGAVPPRRRAWALAGAVTAVALSLLTAGAGGAPPVRAAMELPPDGGSEPAEALTVPTDLDERLVAVGRRLFFDPRLSDNGSMACASCHDLTHGGDDGVPIPDGPEGVPRQFNTPTVFNTVHVSRLGWRGDFLTLRDQVAHSVPAELLSDWAAVTDRLSGLADYADAFPDGVTPEAIQEALAAYVAALVTPHAPFDRWLTGDSDALTDQQKRGWALFKGYGCAACHQGRLLGGTMFQRIGLYAPFFPRYRSDPRADLGRYALTGEDTDRHSFKVPGLRNVALTAPYLHDGSVATLEGVVRVMAYYQVGRSLSEPDVADIVAFLESLTGEVPAIAAPPDGGPRS